jgi:hypothetical protein
LSFLFATASAFCDTHYVCPSGSHISPYTNWLSAATNIQAAIDVTVDGDIRDLLPGVADGRLGSKHDFGGRCAGSGKD